MYLGSYHWSGLLSGNCNMHLLHHWVSGEWPIYRLVLHIPLAPQVCNRRHLMVTEVTMQSSKNLCNCYCSNNDGLTVTVRFPCVSVSQFHLFLLLAKYTLLMIPWPGLMDLTITRETVTVHEFAFGSIKEIKNKIHGWDNMESTCMI